MSQAISNQSAEAWLLECGPTRVLVSAINLLHVVEDTSLRFHLPMAPAHCNSVFVWQQQLMPVVDLPVLINLPTAACQYFCVLGWKDDTGLTEYGVLGASTFPQRVTIADSQSVTPSAEEISQWQDHALCFVSHRGKTIPIIDVARLFGDSQFAQGNDVNSIGMIA